MSKQLTLINVPRCGPSRPTQLRAFREKHGILTHRSKFLAKGEQPWTALLLVDDDKGKSLPAIMAESARAYDESGRTAYSDGELSAVRELCRKNGIPCEL